MLDYKTDYKMKNDIWKKVNSFLIPWHVNSKLYCGVNIEKIFSEAYLMELMCITPKLAKLDGDDESSWKKLTRLILSQQMLQSNSFFVKKLSKEKK